MSFRFDIIYEYREMFFYGALTTLGITVVSITHYMEEAAQADRVLVMSKGHVVMEATPFC